MKRIDRIHVLCAARVAGQAAFVDFLGGMVREDKDFGFVAAPSDVLRAWPMASFTSLVRWPPPGVQSRLPVRTFFPAGVNLFMAGFADLCSYEPSGARGRVSS